MNKNSDITLCLTIGKRPDELRQTLESLFHFEQFEHIIAINDFGDEATNAVFYELCPQGTLINLGHQMGHHRAVDTMYSKVMTPYIFHCEDDWLFTASLDFPDAKTLLDCKKISTVCYRNIKDFPFTDEENKKIIKNDYANISYYRLDGLHKQWHGFTFNPHLSKIDLWHEANSYFSQFKKERHISRWQRKLGRHTAFMLPGACRHIGDGISVTHDNIPMSRFKKTRKQLKYWIKNLLQK